MHLLAKLITLPIRRAEVRARSIPRTVGILRDELDELGVVEEKDIPDKVLLVLVQEAWQRAAESEQDGKARYGMLYREVENIAKEMAAAFRGEPDADSVVKIVLAFHRLI